MSDQEQLETVSVLYYLEKRIAWLESSAKDLAASMDKRLETLNDIRNSLRDQNNTFLTKDSHEAYIKAVDAKFEPLQTWQNKADGQKLTSNIVAVLALVVSLLMAVVELLKK
jgi:tetrahydromethanopterin S-methyltransferase subunit B